MKGKSTFSHTEAEQIVHLIEQKLKADSIKQKGIRDKIRKIGFYASDFGIGHGYTAADFKNAVHIVGETNSEPPKVPISAILPTIKPTLKSNKRANNDESYIIDLCDEVLGLKAQRQHRFDFLSGHSGSKLPVDAYYPSLHLVIEYHEKQHTEEVKFFDRRITSTGITRGEQRKLYDDLRRTEIPKHGLNLLIFSYADFEHNGQKRLIRNTKNDFDTVSQRLKKHIHCKKKHP